MQRPVVAHHYSCTFLQHQREVSRGTLFVHAVLARCRYEFGLFELIRVSPRFGMLLLAMTLSIVFILLDNLAVTKAISGNGLPDGLNPFWKIAFVTVQYNPSRSRSSKLTPIAEMSD